jgi:hypothetical protein
MLFCTYRIACAFSCPFIFFSAFVSKRYVISLKAVSGEHFVILAHFEEVSSPSNPSSNLFSIKGCLSFNSVRLFFSKILPFPLLQKVLVRFHSMYDRLLTGLGILLLHNHNDTRLYRSHFETNFSPTIEPISRKMKKSRQNSDDSLKTKIPSRAVPTAPMPVHTA